MRRLEDWVDEEIFARCPEYIRAVVVACGLDNTNADLEIEVRLSEAVLQAQQVIAAQGLTTHPHIAAWRQAYKAFGMWDGSSYSSIEALARRARNGKAPRRINPLVDLMNMFSLVHFVPVGGDDIERVHGNLVLRRATGSEVFVPFNRDTPEHPPAGEVIYVDEANQVLCRKWNWRQGKATAITPHTRAALCNIDILPPLSHEDAKRLVDELAEWIDVFLGGQVTTALLTASNPCAEITCTL